MPEQKNKKRKITCLGEDCSTEFELDENGEGVCPECRLDMGAILRRDRHEQALDKLRKTRQPKETPTPVQKKDPWGLS